MPLDTNDPLMKVRNHQHEGRWKWPWILGRTNLDNPLGDASLRSPDRERAMAGQAIQPSSERLTDKRRLSRRSCVSREGGLVLSTRELRLGKLSQQNRQFLPHAFASQASAIAFEKYLKTGSSRAFAKRHFV